MFKNPKTIEELRTLRKWRVFLWALLFIVLVVPLEMGLFTVLVGVINPSFQVIIFITCLILPIITTGIIMHEMPYSLEDVTAKKGKWFIEKEIALYEKLLKTSDLPTIIEELNNRVKTGHIAWWPATVTAD